MVASLTSKSIEAFGDGLPLGIMPAKLTSIDVKTKEDDAELAWVSITIEGLEGDAEGLTMSQPFFLKVTKSPKNGKYYSRGQLDAQATAAAWGSPLPEYSLDEFMGKSTPKGARMMQKLLAESFKKAGSPRLKVRIYNEKQQEKNDEGKWVDAKDDDGAQLYRKKLQVMGVIGTKAAAPAEAPSDPSDESDAEASMTFV